MQCFEKLHHTTNQICHLAFLAKIKYHDRMIKRSLSYIFLIATLATANYAAAQTQSPAQSKSETPSTAPAKNDYSKPETWICLPARQDSCAVDQSTTIITAAGKMTTEPWSANPSAPIDCFYVYPTISSQQTPNSNMSLGPDEKGVVRAQLARFGSQCRLYAPLYRQVTLSALRSILQGAVTPEMIDRERTLAYSDVVDAWHNYLDHNNQGRGVVLIGHSQGSTILVRMIHDEIDGKPVQSKLISALLLGTNVPVPKGKDVGGALQHIPLCHAASQTGCLITYVSFRATAPPPDNSRFGHVRDDSMQAACTNPAALAGGSAELHSYLPSGDSSNIVRSISASQPIWVTPPQSINTPFVSVPGMLTAECLSNEHGSYLAVTIHDDPAGARAHDIGGDLTVNGNVLADWGLHLIDMNLTMGNLIDVVGQQSKAYLASTAKHGSN